MEWRGFVLFVPSYVVRPQIFTVPCGVPNWIKSYLGLVALGNQVNEIQEPFGDDLRYCGWYKARPGCTVDTQAAGVSSLLFASSLSHISILSKFYVACG